MGLTEGERRVVEAVEQRRGELVSLATDLIAFDTTARSVVSASLATGSAWISRKSSSFL